MTDELKFAMETVIRAGELILTYFDKPYTVIHKRPSDPVTPADLAADAFLREAFSQRFPADGWLSEETADDPRRLECARVWVVDPLDGTKEFIRGRKEFSISIALVKEGVPHLAVVYNPSLNDLFTAEVGKGAFRNQTPITVSSLGEFDSARILVSHSEAAWFKQLPNQSRIRKVGSIAYKLALVAGRDCDLSISFRPKSEWDVCAGMLLVCEAGGEITDLSGNPLRFNQPSPLIGGVIAANPVLHKLALGWLPTLRTRPSILQLQKTMHKIQ